MNCLCCGKPLKIQTDSQWHPECIKRFFGTSEIPKLELDENKLNALAKVSSEKGYTVTGVQKKLSLQLISDKKDARMTLVDYPAGYILKPQDSNYIAMPESEHLVMSMADLSGIVTVPHALIHINREYGYITKRVDRTIRKNGCSKLAMEDFCQLDLRLTEDKYKGSYERCSKVIDRYSSFPMMDKSELFLRLVFCFITGNSDMHLKNFSLYEKKEKSREYTLSPAYDLLPVNILLTGDPDEMALTINGKTRNIRKKDFIHFAESEGIGKSAGNKMIEKILSLKDKYMDMCEQSLLPANMKEQFAELIQDRCKRLESQI